MSDPTYVTVSADFPSAEELAKLTSTIRRRFDERERFGGAFDVAEAFELIGERMYAVKMEVPSGKTLRARFEAGAEVLLDVRGMAAEESHVIGAFQVTELLVGENAQLTPPDGIPALIVKEVDWPGRIDFCPPGRSITFLVRNDGVDGNVGVGIYVRLWRRRQKTVQSDASVAREKNLRDAVERLRKGKQDQ